MFDRTHEIDGHNGRVVVRQTSLPGPGGRWEQDSLDMQAMGLMRRLWQRVAQEQVARRQSDQEVEQWRASRAEQIRRGEL